MDGLLSLDRRLAADLEGILPDLPGSARKKDIIFPGLILLGKDLNRFGPLSDGVDDHLMKEMTMQERRRDSRIPVRLETMIKQGQWIRHISEDVSRRGIFLRSGAMLPEGQLIQIRVQVPRVEGPLKMMGKVARWVPVWPALCTGRLPGLGIEFFCVSNEALRHWEHFIQQAAALRGHQPNIDAFALRQVLESGEFSQLLEPKPRRQEGQDDRSNLIFRARTLDRLKAFASEELSMGSFQLNIPYPMKERLEVNLRVIHPQTEEEYTLSGRIHQGGDNGSYLIKFDGPGTGVRSHFDAFVKNGIVGPELRGSL